MRHSQDGDWKGRPAHIGDDPGPGDDPGKHLFHLRLPQMQGGRDRDADPQGGKAPCPDSRQLCLGGGGRPYHGAEICDVRTVVPAGTGVEPGRRAVEPADHEQLGAVGGGGLAETGI